MYGIWKINSLLKLSTNAQWKIVQIMLIVILSLIVIGVIVVFITYLYEKNQNKKIQKESIKFNTSIQGILYKLLFPYDGTQFENNRYVSFAIKDNSFSITQDEKNLTVPINAIREIRFYKAADVFVMYFRNKCSIGRLQSHYYIIETIQTISGITNLRRAYSGWNLCLVQFDYPDYGTVYYAVVTENSTNMFKKMCQYICMHPEEFKYENRQYHANDINLGIIKLGEYVRTTKVQFNIDAGVTMISTCRFTQQQRQRLIKLLAKAREWNEKAKEAHLTVKDKQIDTLQCSTMADGMRFENIDCTMFFTCDYNSDSRNKSFVRIQVPDIELKIDVLKSIKAANSNLFFTVEDINTLLNILQDDFINSEIEKFLETKQQQELYEKNQKALADKLLK